jgi:predicted molibdopterin-dependent oxidoreductase YjgC
VISEEGELELTVKINDDLRHDCVMVPIGTPGVNRLTPSVISDEGEGACYGEAKVRLALL